MPAAELSAPDGQEPSPEVAAYSGGMNERAMAEAQRRSLEAGVDSTRRRHGGAAGGGCDGCELRQGLLDSAQHELDRKVSLQTNAHGAEVLHLRTQLRRLRHVVNAHGADLRVAHEKIDRLGFELQAADAKRASLTSEVERLHAELQAGDAKCASLIAEVERQCGASVTHTAELASAQGEIVRLQNETVRPQDEIVRLQDEIVRQQDEIQHMLQATVDRAKVDVTTAQSKALAQAMEHIKQLEARANCSDADRDARATQPLRARCTTRATEHELLQAKAAEIAALQLASAEDALATPQLRARCEVMTTEYAQAKK